MYEACDGGHRQPPEALLKDTLSRILEAFDSTYIIIDSLDECVTKGDLLGWIRFIAAETSGKLHLLVTSRPEPEAQHGLASVANLQKVSIGDQCTTEDISAYLDARLQAPEMDKWREPEKKQIKKALVRGSGGM